MSSTRRKYKQEERVVFCSGVDQAVRFGNEARSQLLGPCNLYHFEARDFKSRGDVRN
jgi:hypothetical protein